MEWHKVNAMLDRYWSATLPICKELFSFVSWVIGVSAVIYAIGLFGWQIFYWLKHGVWISCDLLTLLTDHTSDNVGPRTIVPYFGNALPQIAIWLRHPVEWLGLHKIVTGILEIFPYSVLVILIGAVVISEGTNDRGKV